MWLKTGYFHADRAEAGGNAWPTRTLSHSCIVRLSAICRVLGLDASIRLASESSGGFFRFNSLGAVSLADITPATLTLTRNLAGRQRREHLLDERRDLLDELGVHAGRGISTLLPSRYTTSPSKARPCHRLPGTLGTRYM